MDLKDVLKREIENKRKLQDQAIEMSGAKKRKWLTRGELEKAKQVLEAEAEKQAPSSTTVDKPEVESVVSKKRVDSSDAISEIDKERILQQFKDVSDVKLHRRLRIIGEPIRLFGEDRDDIILRLHKGELANPELLNKKEGNEFSQLLKSVEEKLYQSEVAMPQRTDEAPNSPTHNHETTTQAATEQDDTKEQRRMRIHMGAMHLDNPQWTKEQSIRYFIKHLMFEWEMHLVKKRQDCPEADKTRLALITRDFAMMHQTQDWLKPLLKQLKTRTLDEHVETELGHIVDCAKRREYQKAHDHYIGLAIGNAAWPIGVTMTGIHERSAREKIQQNQVAHILNDEKARKYLQATKRLLTFCQIRYPTDPSKCFEYNATIFNS